MEKKDQGSNNTNKLSPQEQHAQQKSYRQVQIIQINLALKNEPHSLSGFH